MNACEWLTLSLDAGRDVAEGRCYHDVPLSTDLVALVETLREEQKRLHEDEIGPPGDVDSLVSGRLSLRELRLEHVRVGEALRSDQLVDLALKRSSFALRHVLSLIDRAAGVNAR